MAGGKETLYWDEVKRLFVREMKTPEQIAEQLKPVGGPSANTIYKWRDKGGWLEERKALLGNPRSLAEEMRQDLEEKVKLLRATKGLNPADYDALYKIVLAIEKLERSQDLPTVALMVMEEFFKFLKAGEVSPGELLIISNHSQAWFRSLR